jgi:hypothetical protein
MHSKPHGSLEGLIRNKEKLEEDNGTRILGQSFTKLVNNLSS